MRGELSQSTGRVLLAIATMLAESLPEPDLRREFAALGERLMNDPLGAYR